MSDEPSPMLALPIKKVPQKRKLSLETDETIALVV
jgi:hypothetical protein